MSVDTRLEELGVSDLDVSGWGDVDEPTFSGLAERHRRELHVHCYRMLGSPHDAEDAVQETLLRAWRQLAGFEERATSPTSLRASPIRTPRPKNAKRSSSPI
jgi:RNA polymerase sigma-70 factor (ECF subfamily)